MQSDNESPILDNKCLYLDKIVRNLDNKSPVSDNKSAKSGIHSLHKNTNQVTQYQVKECVAEMLKILISALMGVYLFLCSQPILVESTQIKATVPKIKRIDINVAPKEDEVQKFIIEVENMDVLNKVKDSQPSIRLDKVFNTVLQGASIKATAADIEKIKSQPGIKQIHPITTYKVELDKSVPFIGGTLLRGEFDENNERLTGKGVKIGVIDTGIDYTHPDLQRNYKGGYDLVDDDEDPMETVKSQGEATLHGTHVAGIISANGKFLGVAPDAEIYAYRALGPGGYGTSDQVITAIEKAVKDGMDIINLSLGSSVNAPDYPTSIALDKAVEMGVVAVTSNGNSGPGLWTVGSPGASEKAISVGASTPPLEIPVLQLELVPNKSIFLQPLEGSVPWNVTKSHRIVYGGFGSEKELPDDVKDNIVLMERGEISFTDKVKNACNKGAKAVLIFNNKDGLFSGGLEEAIKIPAIALSREDGLFLKKELEKGHNWVKTKGKQVKDSLANFSSRGPVTHTWAIKPDVVAPGVKINSSIPDGYVSLQGTSMAAPHVAGAAALILQAHPDWNPEQVKAALMNTARPILDDAGKQYNPYEQGAGRIQVDKAVKANVLAYPGTLAYGAFEKTGDVRESALNITIENKSNKVQKISFQAPKIEEGIKWKLPLSLYLQPLEKRQVAASLFVDTEKIIEGTHFGSLKMISTSDGEIDLPYLFIIGDANHPRVMGFSFEKENTENKEEDAYKYEVYLPERADELGIALFDPLTLNFVGFLLHERNVKRGLLEVVKQREEIPFADGVYKVVVYAIQNGRETAEENTIIIGEKGG